MQKKAILVVSFGTTYGETCEKNIQAIEAEIGHAFPEWEIRRAFTSGMIRAKLKSRDGVRVDSVEQALSRLAEEGFDAVLCQPTHVINGEEFDDIVQAASAYRESFAVLKIGTPLLTYAQDYRRLAEILSNTYPAKAETVYCWMGHGSERHPADAAYAALEYHFSDIGRDDFLVGTVEGFPDFDAMVRRLNRSKAKQCVLLPLMVVAGDHAVNDMASEEEDSWKTLLERDGFSVTCMLKGMGEYAGVREMYVQHVQAMMKA